MENEILLYSKDSFKFIKKGENIYSVNYILENNDIQLDKTIDFPFIKLIYDLNKDIIERIDMKIKDNRALIIIVIKDIFEDLGIPQYYSCMIIHRKEINDNKGMRIEFISELLIDKNEMGNAEMGIVPEEAEKLPILRFNSEYVKKNNNKIDCIHNVEIKNEMNSNSISVELVEKMVGKILYKIFNRMILFIKSIKIKSENVCVL